MDPTLYFPVFLLVASLLSLSKCFVWMGSNDMSMFERGNASLLFPAALCIVFSIWIGHRPIWSSSFGDTFSYALNFFNLENESYEIDYGSEWVLTYLMKLCHMMGLGVFDFLTLVAFIYTLTLLYAIKILMPGNVILGLLFCLTSFSFFTFASNGIRNGTACHIVILAFALYLDDKQLPGAVLGVLAFFTHRSVILPIASFFAAIYLIKKPKTAVMIWVASIFVSFVAGGFFTALFASLGFDDRMDQYTSDSLTHRVGGTFRWDFLAYSAMPVLMTWYVCVKKNLADNWYRVLATTYCLSNTFWVLVIRAAFSNRFAYLSWFLYPIIIAYPLVNTLIWRDQDFKTGLILLMYVMLTVSICYFTGLI